MREILFRGKRIDNGEWVEGDLLRAKYYLNDIDRCFIFNDAEAFPANEFAGGEEVLPETVGQYTGLNDSTKWEQLTEKEQSDWLKSHTVDEWKGRRIFEGDVVDILTENEEIGIVTYDDGGFWVEADGFCVDFHSNINGTDLEVIGNIHDNPELMKER